MLLYYKKSRISTIIKFVSVLFVIYVTDSLLFATSDIAYLNLIRDIFAAVVAFFLFIVDTRRLYLPLLFICASIMISMILGIGAVSSGAFYIIQVSLLVFSYEYSKHISFEFFCDSYLVWMRIIALVSLFAFAFRSILLGLSFIPTVHTGGLLYYKSLLFTNLPLSASYGRRNFGPFWEPGVFQFYLNMALMFTLFRENKRWVIDALLFIIADITTLSGAALIPIPFILFAFILKKNNHRKHRALILFSGLLFVALLVLFESGILDEIVYKLAGIDGERSDSFGIRMGSLKGNILVTISHPIFGASPDLQYLVRGQQTELLANVFYPSNTNTITGLFASFGVAVGLYCTIRLFCFTKNFSEKRSVRFLLFFAVILATSNEELGQSIMFMTLLFIGQTNNTGLSFKVHSRIVL